jgi:hypothetical protein
MEYWAGDSPIQIHIFVDLKLLTQLGIYAFFTHALHHPLEETALPPNARHGAVASFGVPWNKVQEAQYCPIVYCGYFFVSIFLILLT